MALPPAGRLPARERDLVGDALPLTGGGDVACGRDLPLGGVEPRRDHGLGTLGGALEHLERRDQVDPLRVRQVSGVALNDSAKHSTARASTARSALVLAVICSMSPTVEQPTATRLSPASTPQQRPSISRRAATSDGSTARSQRDLAAIQRTAYSHW